MFGPFSQRSNLVHWPERRVKLTKHEGTNPVPHSSLAEIQRRNRTVPSRANSRLRTSEETSPPTPLRQYSRDDLQAKVLSM
uniref:Uncharacterized protein n=1 Tax=Timema cristinae TaxID=61476 RepID=A0A7R9DMN4_TIMCR|nr:unnamed protein product [Timema cristinae]